MNLGEGGRTKGENKVILDSAENITILYININIFLYLCKYVKREICKQ